MKITFIVSLLLFTFFTTAAQKPKNGIYTYTVAFAEWQGKSLGTTCTVIIKGDSITIRHNGKGKLTGKKGDILERGILLKHTRTGKWIIAHSKKDKDAEHIGGCTGGPSIIDFKNKKYWTC